MSEWIATSGSCLSAKDSSVHFSLGSDAVVKSGEILWPGGIHQKVDDVRADEMLRIDSQTTPAAAKNLAVQASVGK